MCVCGTWISFFRVTGFFIFIFFNHLFACNHFIRAGEMNRLPRETFLIVASYLDFETKFELACTCKHWYTIISTHNLYETVSVDRDLEPAMKFFKENKPFRSTVKSLQVNVTGLSFSWIKKWPVYFPNLVNLSLSSAEIDVFASDYDDECDLDYYPSDEEYLEQDHCFTPQDEAFKKWGKLTSLSEFTRYLYTGTILHSGYYPDLSLLDLNFSIVPDTMVDKVMDHLLMGMGHAPNLNFFKLIAAKLTLKKLDLLHHHASHLQVLVLEDMMLGEDTTIMNQFTSQPASSLIRLEMQGNRYSFYENDDLCITDWLDYIALKYPKIEILKMNQFTPASEAYDSCIIHLVEHCPNLKTFNVDVCHLSADVLRALDDTQIRLEKYSSQSQDMTQLRNLSLSKQRHSVYRLDLVVPMGSNANDFINCLSQFTGLTTINTYPSSDVDYTVGKPLHVPINTFLRQHSRLEFLTLSSCVLCMDPEEEEGGKSVLDTLELEKVIIQDPSVLDFIPKACSSLQVMVLKARFISKDVIPNTTRLNFSNHSLVYMDIYIKDHAFIHVVENGVRRCYKFIQEDRKLKYVLIQHEEEEKEHVLEIQARSIDRISLGAPRDPFPIVDTV